MQTKILTHQKLLQLQTGQSTSIGYTSGLSFYSERRSDEWR